MTVFGSFVHKEMIHIFRDVRTTLIVLLMPVLLMVLFGFAVSTEINNINVAVVVDEYTPDVRRQITALEHNPYITLCGTIRERDVDVYLRSGKVSAVVLFGLHGSRNIVLDASNSSLSASAGSYITSILNSDQAAPLPIATYMRHNPQLKSAYNFVPGVMGLIFILICALMTCVSVVREKEMGTMEVLLVSPIQPVYIVLAKMVPYLLISLINLVTIIVLSNYVLGMPIHAGNLPTLLTLCVLYIILSLMLGLLVSTIAESQMVALLICAMVMMMPMMMLSGMMFPVENLPPVLKELTYVVPARWFNEACRKVLVEGLSFGGVWKEFVILSGMTLVVFAASLKNFKDRLE